VLISIPKTLHTCLHANAGRADELRKSNVFHLHKRPKGTDFWFVHVNILSEPYKTEYRVTEIMKDDLYQFEL
jgi:KUP system potassium uptake protein